MNRTNYAIITLKCNIDVFNSPVRSNNDTQHAINSIAQRLYPLIQPSLVKSLYVIAFELFRVKNEIAIEKFSSKLPLRI